jgi:hypothetical protein
VRKLLEGVKTWLQSMNDASASDVIVSETVEKRAEATATRRGWCATPISSDRRHILFAGAPERVLRKPRSMAAWSSSLRMNR